MNPFGFTANLLDLVFIILGKSGKFLNARGLRICFIIDTVCVGYWFYIDIERGLFAQAASCLLTIGINIYGWNKWGKDK